jgi:hypothetical protein
VILIFAYVREIEPEAAKQRLIIALQQTVETADDRPLESAQDAICARGTTKALRRVHQLRSRDRTGVFE